ncbi:MAG: hypothetical protein KIH69_017960 [Anaerolineae bacterium]|nr:hypothetical protein [Anaerolineae bacterium]
MQITGDLPNKSLKNDAVILSVNLIFAVFTIIFNWADPLVDLPQLIYSRGDSLDYLAVANWLFDYPDSGGLFGYINIRPFLYPLMIGFIRLLLGDQYIYVLYYVQLLMLFLSANLIGQAIYKFSKSTWLAGISTLLLLCNFSLMGLTRHALSEVPSLFFVSLFIFAALKPDEGNWRYLALFFIVLAAVVRPIYLIMMCGWLFYLYWYRSNKNSPIKALVKVLLCVIPILIQYYLVYLYTGQLFFSEISSLTFRDWFMSQLYFKVEWQTTWTFEQATEEVAKMSTFEMATYIFSHLRDAQYVYRTNILQEGLLYGAEYGPSAWRDLSIKIHTTFAVLHGIMLPVLLFYIVKAIKKRFIPPIFVIYMFFIIHVLSTGISAWQGDRLIVTAAPLWITVYLWVISQWTQKIRPQAG